MFSLGFSIFEDFYLRGDQLKGLSLRMNFKAFCLLIRLFVVLLGFETFFPKILKVMSMF